MYVAIPGFFQSAVVFYSGCRNFLVDPSDCSVFMFDTVNKLMLSRVYVFDESDYFLGSSPVSRARRLCPIS